MAPRNHRYRRRAPRTGLFSWLRETSSSLGVLYLLLTVPNPTIAGAPPSRPPSFIPSGPPTHRVNRRSEEINPVSAKIPTVKNKDDSWIPDFSPFSNASAINDYDDETMSATSHMYLPGMFNARTYISNGYAPCCFFPSSTWFSQHNL